MPKSEKEGNLFEVNLKSNNSRWMEGLLDILEVVLVMLPPGWGGQLCIKQILLLHNIGCSTFLYIYVK